jgi:AcrR family transcriptional regulator
MAEIDTTQDDTTQDDTTHDADQGQRCRGRPQVRPDDETRQIIFEAARHEFAAGGYAATSIETVARLAGVSTKTLYRLIPNKAALFGGIVSDRLDRFASEVELQVGDADIETALGAALMVCADLALDEEVIAMQRIILQETAKFSDLAGVFYRNAIVRTGTALADWLRVQVSRGLIALDDVDEAADMLLGMVTSAPRRAALFGHVPLPPRPQIEARVRRCAAIFLRGCQRA